VIVTDAPDRPQPRRDAMAGDGMSVTVGRVREDHLFDLRLVVSGHNTIRGAAGGSILNAEIALGAPNASRSARAGGSVAAAATG
jgi:aspartate-semialdehyde dehydrogenase